MKSGFFLGTVVGILGGVGLSLLYSTQEADVEAMLPVSGDSKPAETAGLAPERNAEPKPMRVAKAATRSSRRDLFTETDHSVWEEAGQPPSVPDGAEIVDPELEQELQRLSDETYDALDELDALGEEGGLSKEQLDLLYEAEDQHQKSLAVNEQADDEELTLDEQIDGTLNGLRESGAPDEVIEHFLASLDSMLDDGVGEQESALDMPPPPPPAN